MNYNFNTAYEEIHSLSKKCVYMWIGIMVAISLITTFLCAIDVLPLNSLWSLLWFVPMSIFLIVSCIYYRKRIFRIYSEQRKILLEYISNRPDYNISREETYFTDCQIKMRYLSKKGIDIDAAIERLGGDIETYHKLAIEFAHNCEAYEDELFVYLTTEELTKFGSLASQLRSITNQLGLTNLTDTLFFLEIEAYAGSVEVVELNWHKLSFELDEAHYILSKYLNSVKENISF